MSDLHTQKVLDALGAAFPAEAIKTRQGGGGARLRYVEAHTVIRRLNTATGGHWDFAVLHEEQTGDLLKATCRLTIPGLGSREHVGVQKVSERGGEDLHKGAISDALKKCATLFGVGLELYGEAYEDDDYAASQPRSAPPARLPAPAPTTRHGPPQPVTAPQAALEPERFGRLIDNLWVMFEDGQPYAALVDALNAVRPQMTAEQKEVARLELPKLRAAYAERDTQPAPAAPSFASVGG